MNSESQQQQIINDQYHNFRLNTPKQTLQKILDQAMAITPFLTKQQLLQIFKQYYENQSIFFNKLQLLAKNRELNTTDTEGWIINQRNQRKQKQQYPKDLKSEPYSFLNDRKVLNKIKYPRVDQKEQSEEPQQKHSSYIKKRSENNNKFYRNNTFNTAKPKQISSTRQLKRYKQKTYSQIEVKSSQIIAQQINSSIELPKQAQVTQQIIPSIQNIAQQTIKIQPPKSVDSPQQPIQIQQFNNECRNNQYILKFIKPLKNKVQHIQYIWTEQAISAVKVKVVTTIQ